MEKIGIRDLRNRTSEVVRRVRGGERILITSNGIPVAEIGPVADREADSIEDLAMAGLIRLPRTNTRPPTPEPLVARNGLTTEEVLDDLRSR